MHRPSRRLKVTREDRLADSNINGVDSVTDEGGSTSTALMQVKRLGELWVCSKSYNVVVCAAHFVSASNFDIAMHAAEHRNHGPIRIWRCAFSLTIKQRGDHSNNEFSTG